MILILMQKFLSLLLLWIICPQSKNHSKNSFPLKQRQLTTKPKQPRRTRLRPSVRRQLTRYAFEFYQDQVEELRRLSLEEKMQGGKGSMSEMVREAIDDYLTEKKRTDE